MKRSWIIALAAVVVGGLAVASVSLMSQGGSSEAAAREGDMDRPTVADAVSVEGPGSAPSIADAAEPAEPGKVDDAKPDQPTARAATEPGQRERRQGEQREGPRDGGFGFRSALEQMDLTAQQKGAIDAITQSFRKDMEAMRDQDVPMEERRAKFAAHREELMKKINEVLTAEQRAKFEELLREQRSRRDRENVPDRNRR